MTRELEIEDIVICTVERIAGTVVFVNIDEFGKQGSIVLSEIAPGRIRNLRDYVFPGKKIICKILRISGDSIDLSLRRVTPKEQKEIRDRTKLKKSYESIFKTILGEKAEKIIYEIEEKEDLYEFMEEARENPEPIEKILGKENAKKILDILNSQKKKKFMIKKEIILTSSNQNGMSEIKKILGNLPRIEVSYISAGHYLLKIEDENPKKADQELKASLKDIEKKAKKEGLRFDFK